MTFSFSTTSTSSGVAIESHPPTGPETLGSKNVRDAVRPAVTITRRSAEPASLVTVTVCSSAARSGTVSGDVPRNWPSMKTRAPGGSVTTDTPPRTGTPSRHSASHWHDGQSLVRNCKLSPKPLNRLRDHLQPLANVRDLLRFSSNETRISGQGVSDPFGATTQLGLELRA